MGGGLTYLRQEIQTHINLTKKYPLYIEPYLLAVRYFLQTAESSEGIDKDQTLEIISPDTIIADKKVATFASTDIECLAEYQDVFSALLHGIAKYHEMILSPENIPQRIFNRELPSAFAQKVPKDIEIQPYEIKQYQIAILRASIRCLRLLMFIEDGRNQFIHINGFPILNTALLENPLDNVIQTDIKAIFQMVYGDKSILKRIECSNLTSLTQMMIENTNSYIIQYACLQRINEFISFDQDNTNIKLKQLLVQFQELDLISLVTNTFHMFQVERHYPLYFLVCRWISFIGLDEMYVKLLGQKGCVQGSIRLLLHARAMHRDAVWSYQYKQDLDIPTTFKDTTNPLEGVFPIINYTPTEISQQALWALDALAKCEYNIVLMKENGLIYILQDIHYDSSSQDIDTILIQTYRLRQIIKLI